jgi:hypothetical protein
MYASNNLQRTQSLHDKLLNIHTKYTNAAACPSKPSCCVLTLPGWFHSPRTKPSRVATCNCNVSCSVNSYASPQHASAFNPNMSRGQ